MSADEPVSALASIDTERNLREAVFMLLLDAAEPMTPSEVGEALGKRRETVYHHLNSFVEEGFVVRADGEYFVQPVFVDPEFSEAFTEAIAMLTPHVERGVFTGDAAHPDEVVLHNVLKTAMAMELLGHPR